ncbi:hypothetical protein [Niabella ginsengisoli]|uniref:Carboxypeptidase regulatory-like domain-containing protein n=1 Tax=Niabella ginsengisoli TaxID=522298 RepID=A0ABS9SKV1_9BACT|nr:hypothetical protein [Niabella ginsengisoli]MCH5599004.1 hypothetical protein [Niabella ginsengisoli]
MLLSSGIAVFGQNIITVTGTVTDHQAQPLPAVTVEVKGWKQNSTYQ